MSTQATHGGATRGVFGYLPGHADYVRVRADSREVRALADWIEQGLHQARWEMGSEFDKQYPQLFHRFVFRPDNSPRTAIGVMAASVDSHQRPFPFVAFELLPTADWDRDPVRIATANKPFFDDLEQMIRDVGPLPSLGQIHGRVLACQASLRGLAEEPADAEAARDEARYANFLDELTCGELGIPGQLSGAAICAGLLDLFERSTDPRQLRYALELPLSRTPYARDLEMRFFLSLLRMLARERQPTWTLFWQYKAAALGAMTISFRQPTIDIFAALLRRDGLSRGVVKPGGQPAREQESDHTPGSTLEPMTLVALLRGLTPPAETAAAPAQENRESA